MKENMLSINKTIRRKLETKKAPISGRKNSVYETNLHGLGFTGGRVDKGGLVSKLGNESIDFSIWRTEKDVSKSK